MYITVEYGDNQNLLVNPDCPTKIFTEYIHKKCNFPKDIHEDKSLKKITPILKDWEKKYPNLERKLRHRDKKAKQGEQEQVRAGSGGRRQSMIRPVSSKKSSVSNKKSVNSNKKKKDKK
ncbi:uncharacterized protein LOC127736440 isoform X2 [Mytilus californianus]|uniref:uncharacterized protein LOC127736440 isoform X2 n=1 Tax=Mytilus californianus TaxID=6549 RepID=UPI0022470F66|nr:uncharacterized protein LOC127736440 isoform X2 [Mytilus californianus]